MDPKKAMDWSPDAHTELYGIIGHPVRHSMSPAMHNAAFRYCGMNAVYLAFDVVDLKGAMGGVRALGVKGLSVTIPHKQAVIPLLDETDRVARRIGAVNTVVNQEGTLLGYNTDWVGAVKALEEVTPLEGKKVVVLGAGGAARAVCMGLEEAGAKVHIANRTVRRAADLAALSGASWSGLDGLGEVHGDVLVNTTSVGMSPNEDEIPVDPRFLDRYPVVMDLVYSPLETRLLRMARANGAVVINGLRMLLLQALAQFELWTGRAAPVEVMERALGMQEEPRTR